MNVKCPLCNTEDSIIIYKKLPKYLSDDIVKCSKCNHVYTYLNREIEIDRLYNDEVYQVVENQRSIFDTILNREYNKVIKKINSLRQQKSSLLDFGSGKGKFGSLAKENGWSVKCVETSAERAAYAMEVYGLDVNTKFYSAGNIFNTRFDVLTLFHVLEHLPHPKPLLKELIENNLNKEALIIIEVPNFKSLQSSIAKDKWMHLDTPRHLSHFTPEQLGQFSNELGLILIEKSHFSIHLGVLGMVDSLLKLFGYRRNIIYDLKNKKSDLFMLSIVLLLPLAFLLEYFFSLAGKGGIIRNYFVIRKEVHRN